MKPGLPAYAVRLKPDAVRELGLTTMQLAASLRAYVNGDVATWWTSPDGEQVDVELRLPQASRENIAQLDDLPVAYAKDGTPIALARVADVVPVVNPVVIKRQDLQRRQAVYAGTEAGRAATSAPTSRRSSRRASCRRATASTWAGRRGPAGGVPRRALRARRGGDLHLHRARVAVRQLPAADRDHGVAAAGADRRDAGAAGDALDAQPVLDDRPGDADGAGHQERDPARRLRQPRRKTACRCPRRCCRPGWCGCGRSS